MAQELEETASSEFSYAFSGNSGCWYGQMFINAGLISTPVSFRRWSHFDTGSPRSRKAQVYI